MIPLTVHVRLETPGGDVVHNDRIHYLMPPLPEVLQWRGNLYVYTAHVAGAVVYRQARMYRLDRSTAGTSGPVRTYAPRRTRAREAVDGC